MPLTFGKSLKYALAMSSMGPLSFPFDKDGKKTLWTRLRRWVPYLLLAAIVTYNRKNIKAIPHQPLIVLGHVKCDS